MPDTEDRYARLDAARWLAAVAVVLLHSAALIVSDPAAYGGGAWLAANLYDSAARWCVPVFVMVSGALLLDPDKPQDALKFYSRRMARICAPLVFWTLFYLTWRTGLDWWDDGRVDFSFWPRKVVQGEPYYHLWYLYMIVGLYLFAPLARMLYARSTPRGRSLWVVGILGVAILDWPVLHAVFVDHDIAATKGLAFPLLAAFGWAAGTVYLKRWPVAGNRIVVTAWQLVVGAACALTGMLIAGESFPTHGWNARVAGALAFHIILGTAVAYWLWLVLSEKGSATVAALTTLMVPVVGVLGAMALVGDRPGAADWLGFAFVLAGAALIVLNLGKARG
ncbi:hypothetical protein G6F65_014792 [Rhizopus arrhizus]|nr:hypothetical protein G6F65_014792 [Rhizopus arrhizus]